MTSRRSFLQSSALTLAALSWAPPALAGSLAPERRKPFSVSESFVFPEWVSAMHAAKPDADRADQAFWAAWQRVSGVTSMPGQSSPEQVILLSLPAPGVEMFAPDHARDLARLNNDRLAEAIAASGGRLAGLATVAAFDPAAVDEAERAITRLGLTGLSLGANRGLRLDHPSLRPVFAFAAAVGVPIYLPAGYAPSTGDAPYRATGSEGILAGAGQDSARHATQLIFGGVLDADPRLRVVLARLGEGTPYWCKHLTETYIALQRAGRPLPRRAPLAYFTDNILLTTADICSPETLAFCGDVIGQGRTLHSQTGAGDGKPVAPRLQLAGWADLSPV